MSKKVVIDAGHGGICLTQCFRRMATNLVNVRIKVLEESIFYYI